MSSVITGTILLVDDESNIRDILNAHIEGIGCEVIEAINGEDAFKKIKQHKIDVVVSDIAMPKMTGVEFLQRLRNENYNLPFVFITGHASVNSTIQALRLGAFDYIEKPFNLKHVERVIVEALRVSLERQRLEEADFPGDLENDETSESGNSTEEVSHLMQAIRALRSKDPSFSEAIQEEEMGSDSRQIIEPLVAETVSQLVFCEAAIQGLQDPENGSYEVGYLFRVMQSIRMAAEALNLEDITRFAQEIEDVYVFFRVKGTPVQESHTKCLLEANEALKLMVESLEGKPPLDEERLESVLNQLQKIKNSTISRRELRPAS